MNNTSKEIAWLQYFWRYKPFTHKVTAEKCKKYITHLAMEIDFKSFDHVAAMEK